MTAPALRTATETSRLLALSDGVISIAITLLTFDLVVPALPPGAPPGALFASLAAQWQSLLGYALSFLTIALYWILHRRLFVYVDAHDRGVLWLNVLFLLLVAVVPFATSVFSRYPTRVGVTFYATVLALTGFSLTLLWLYVSRNRLLAAGLSSRLVGIEAARFLAAPVVFVFSILVATVDPTLAILSWLLLVPINGLLQSRLVAAGEPPLGDA